MNFDLDVRSKRLEKEHLKLREDARKKREKDLISRANMQKLDEELRELNQKKKLEAEELEIERQRLEDEENQLTGGIKFQDKLELVVIEGEDDKVILPESALLTLSSQDSFGRGAAVFQLTVTSEDGSTRITHCGVREFSADPGKIGLPPKVISSLWGENAIKGSVSIKYVRLSKITYVKLQPTFNQFFKVEQVKMVLEENLKFHSTLTIGDILTVWYRGKAHPLKVVEMKPFEKGILLDTDVEVDLDNSLENKSQKNTEDNSPTRVSSNQSNQSKGMGSHSGHRLSSNTSSSPSSSSSSAIFNQTQPSPGLENVPKNIPMNVPKDEEFSERIFQNPLENLPSEPEVDADDVVSIRVRMPAGNTINRRFYRRQPLSHLFEFASSEMKVEKKVLQLSTRFPNRVFTLNEMEPFDVSFVEAGITASQEMFLASVIV